MHEDKEVKPPTRKERWKKLVLKYLGRFIVVLVAINFFVIIAQQIVPNYNREFKEKYIQAPYSKHYIVPVKVGSTKTVSLDVCVSSSTLYEDEVALDRFKSKAVSTISLANEPIQIAGNCSESDADLTYFNID